MKKILAILGLETNPKIGGGIVPCIIAGYHKQISSFGYPYIIEIEDEEIETDHDILHQSNKG